MAKASPRSGVASKPPLVSTSSPLAAGGYCIWEYAKGAWALKSTSCARGYLPGGPPPQAGKFEGELVKKHCEAAAVPSAPAPKSTPEKPGRVKVSN